MKEKLPRLVATVFLLLAVTTANALILHGTAKSNSKKGIFTNVEVILIYDQSRPLFVLSHEEGGPIRPVYSGWHARISVSWERKKSDEYDFVITQYPQGSNSLIGYFVSNGGRGDFPTTLRVDTWDKEKPFYLYSPDINADVIYIGKFEERK